MSLFNSNEDRELWIKLNAEHQIAWEKGLTYLDKTTKTYKPTDQALHPRSMETAMEIARTQCSYDEREGKLRITLEQYLTLSTEQLNEVRRQRHLEWCKKFQDL